MATDLKVPLQLDKPEEHRLLPPPKDPQKPKRHWGMLTLLLIAGLLAFAAYRWTETRKAEQAAAASKKKALAAARVPVAAVPTRKVDMPIYLNGLGSVTAYNTVTVKTRVDGQIVQVFFKEGETVKAGDALIEIDPRPYQVQLQQAQGQLARDEAQLGNARADLNRYQSLAERGIIARQQRDAQEALVHQNEGVIQSDRAAIANAQLQLTYCHIVAPIGGRIGLRLVDIGNMVHASDQTGLLVITQLQPIAVVFTIPQDDLPSVMKPLSAGQRLASDAFNRDGTVRIASGSLLTVDNQIDQSTGTSRLKAVFPNENNALFPNQFVNVRLQLGVNKAAIVMPVAALQRGPQGTYVYVVKPDQTAELRMVKAGVTQGSQMSVESGLSAGERVVVDGADKIQQGTRVDVRPAQPAAGSKPSV